MTQEDKELLLKDLCARLPYGVICHYDTIVPMVGKVKSYGRLYNISFFDVKPCFQFHCNRDIFDFDNVKPYLFPLSSMTEEQQEEFDRIYADDMQVVANNLKNRLDGKPYETNLGHYRHIDWLNANHFDYRGLIEKGLALDATGLNIY